MGYSLYREQKIPRSRIEVLDFFSNPFNLEKITPHFLRFRILTNPPLSIRENLHLDYRLALFSVPFRWETLIEEWTPPDRFVDVQLRGPYKLWRHTHTFIELDPNLTLMTDFVEYDLFGGSLVSPLQSLLVSPVLDRIFDYRANTIAALFSNGISPDSHLASATQQSSMQRLQ